jgi:hypothetical protein
MGKETAGKEPKNGIQDNQWHPTGRQEKHKKLEWEGDTRHEHNMSDSSYMQVKRPVKEQGKWGEASKELDQLAGIL